MKVKVLLLVGHHLLPLLPPIVVTASRRKKMALSAIVIRMVSTYEVYPVLHSEGPLEWSREFAINSKGCRYTQCETSVHIHQTYTVE